MARAPVLVPYQLDDGRVIPMPDYLVPPEKRLKLPEVGAPSRGPDERTASNDNFLAQASPDFRAVQDAASKPVAGSMLLRETPVPEGTKAPEQDAEQRLKQQDREKATALAKQALGQGGTKLKQVAAPDPRQKSGTTEAAAEYLYGKKPTGGKADPNNLNLIPAEQKIERSGGRDLLPEYKWKYGLEQRPDLGQELDPDAEQPTWGTEDPITRARTTPIERGMASAKAAALKEGQRQIEAAQAQHNANMGVLTQQSELYDRQQAQIAERRAKIASLQTQAETRAKEAKGLEPRTKEQVWESKGPVGQLFSIIGMALGGYLQGSGRTRNNPGFDMVQKLLDDEVQGDVDRYNRAEGRHSKAQSEFDKAMTLYGDLDSAMLDSRMRKLSNVQAMIAEQAQMKGLDDTAKDRLAQMGAAAETAYLETVQQLHDRIGGTVTKQEVTLKPQGEVMKAARAGGGGTGGGATTRGAGAAYGMKPEDYAKLTKENRGLAVKLPNGRFKFVRSPEDRKDVQAQLNATTDMANILRQVQQWRSQKWNTAMWTEKKGQIEANMTRLLELSKRKDMLGALDKGLLDFASKKFGNPEDFTFGSGGEIDGKLAQQITNIQNEQQGIIERDLDDTPLDLTEGGISADGIEH